MGSKDNSNPAFELDTRIEVKIERELASHVGNIILDSDTSNTAAVAFGYQLKRLSEQDEGRGARKTQLPDT